MNRFETESPYDPSILEDGEVEHMPKASFDVTSRRPLDEIGILEGTDKSSLCHCYLDHYARSFEPLRSLTMNVIEIGVANGASARMWQQYFPSAQIIGVDIDESCRSHASDRIVIETGSQIDPQFLADLVKRYPPTIIIDDGSHEPDHQVRTFELLFQELVPGGCYVVEDLHIHPRSFRDDTIANGILWPPDYFAAFAAQLMDGEVPAHFNTPHRQSLLHSTRRVESIHGSVLVWRHEPYRYLTPHDPSWLLATVGALDLHYGWGHLGNYYLRAGAPAEQALAAFEHAVTLMPNNPTYWDMMISAAQQCTDRRVAEETLFRIKGITPYFVSLKICDLLAKWSAD